MSCGDTCRCGAGAAPLAFPWCRCSAWRPRSAMCRKAKPQERRDPLAVSPPTVSGTLRRRFPARLLSALVALRARHRPPHRRGPGTRWLDRHAVGSVARAAARLRPAPCRHARALLPRPVASPPPPGRPGVVGGSRQLAAARKGRRARAPGGLPGRRLPAAAHVAGPHEWHHRHLPHDLAEPGDRARAVRPRRGAPAPLVWRLAPRPLCAVRWTTRHADLAAAPAVLGLERRAAAALHVILPPHAGVPAGVPRRARPLPRDVSRGVHVL